MIGGWLWNTLLHYHYNNHTQKKTDTALSPVFCFFVERVVYKAEKKFKKRSGDL